MESEEEGVLTVNECVDIAEALFKQGVVEAKKQGQSGLSGAEWMAILGAMELNITGNALEHLQRKTTAGIVGGEQIKRMPRDAKEALRALLDD